MNNIGISFPKTAFISIICVALLYISTLTYSEEVSPLFAQSLEKSKQHLEGKEIDFTPNRTNISGKEDPNDAKMTSWCQTLYVSYCYEVTCAAGTCYGSIEIDPESYDFNYVEISDSKEAVFILSAHGTESTDLEDVYINGDSSFEIIQAPMLGWMQNGTSQDIIIRFSPTEIGEVVATLYINTNENDLSVPLIGGGGYNLNPPYKPVCISPEDGTIDLPIKIVLSSSDFSDPDEDTYHLASQWQVDENNGDFSYPIFDSGINFDNLTSIVINHMTLKSSSHYCWRVRYYDNYGLSSEWSIPSSFQTRKITSYIVPTNYTTIQEAIDAAPDCEEVLVLKGIYRENIGIYNKGLRLTSLDPDNINVIENTVIDGDNYNEYNNTDVINLGYGIDGSKHSIITGFTLQNGSYGIDAGQSSHHIIKNNIIKNNWIGICYFYDDRENAIIDGIIENNLIINNRGGGIISSDAIIRNNVIAYNDDGYGDSGGLYNCYGDIRNNIIWGNEGVSQIIESSIPNYCCIQDYIGDGEGNITNNPMFVNSDNGDFHLQEGSPCIDAGDPAPEYNDKSLPPGLGTKRNDIGAYGGPENYGWPVGYDFIDDSEGWISGGASGYFTLPYFWAGNGVLMIYSADHNTYGYWEQPHDAVPYIPNSIYKATFRVRGTVNEVEAPTLRCRINTESATVIGLIVIESFLGGEESPGLEYKDYVLYLDPMDQSGYQDNELSDDIFAAVEMVNMWADNNVSSGFYIESINIDRIDKALIPEAQTVKIYDTSNDFLSWEFGGVEPLFTIPIGERTADSLTLTANNNNTNTYGFWDLSRTCNEIDIEPNKLYKVKFTVSSPTTQEFTPMLRLRINTESNKMAYVHTIYSNLDGTNSPTSSGTQYETYFYPPQSDVGQAEEINGLILGFDLANIPIAIPDDPNGTLKLDKVEVQTIDMELMP